MKQLVVVEIEQEIFNELINSNALKVCDVVVRERYQAGDPEMEADIKLLNQARTDRSLDWKAASKQIDVIEERINNQRKS